MGYSRPSKGVIQVFGKDSFTSTEEILGRVGYLPGEIALPDGLTGTSFLQMEEKLRGGTGEPPRLKELLNLFSLNPNMTPKMMSLGDKRKLAVVAAFMDDPEVLILDEPTSGLDPLMQERFIAFIIGEKKRGKTILLSSHLFPEVDATCDSIAIIKDGHHVSSFKADEFKHPGLHYYLVKIVDPKQQEAFAKENFKFDDATDGYARIEVKDQDINHALETLSKYDIEDLKEEKFSLESYFMSFYEEKKTFTGLGGIEGGQKK